MPEKTDRELLQETHATVIALNEQVKTLAEKVIDHEKRLRFLERYGAALIGMGIMLQMVLNNYSMK